MEPPANVKSRLRHLWTGEGVRALTLICSVYILSIIQLALFFLGEIRWICINSAIHPEGLKGKLGNGYVPRAAVPDIADSLRNKTFWFFEDHGRRCLGRAPLVLPANRCRNVLAIRKKIHVADWILLSSANTRR